jgi:hypothetical protein
LLLVGLIATLLCAPFFRILVIMGDEGELLREAELILQGKQLYADFFQFLPPGSILLTAMWFSIAGISFGSARLLALLTMLGIACLTYLACRQASRNARLSVALVIGWVMMSAWPWMQISHHWFATLLSMLAAWASLASLDEPQHWLRWPLIAGAAAGATGMFVPHWGALTVLAALAAFLNLRQTREHLIIYALGCAIAPLAVFAYLLEQHTVALAFDDVILFTAAHYSSVNTVPFGFRGVALNSPLRFVFALVSLLTLLVYEYDRRACLRDRRLWLCAAFALAGFLGCYPRPDMVHISYSVPLALPLLAFCMTRLRQSWGPAYRYTSAALLIGLCALSALHYQLLARQTLRTEIVQTPRGDVALYGAYTAQRGVPELLANIAATPSGDAYFFYPYDAMLPFLTGREQVSKYELFQPGYTTPAQYTEACRSVMRRASWVVVDQLWTDYFDVWKQVFPSMPDAEWQRAVRFREVLDAAFELVPSTSTFELRHRREGVNDVLCDGIAEE